MATTNIREDIGLRSLSPSYGVRELSGAEAWFRDALIEELPEEESVQTAGAGLGSAVSDDTRFAIALVSVTAQAKYVAHRSGESLTGGLAQFMVRRMALLQDRCARLESELSRIKRELNVAQKQVTIYSLRADRYTLTRELSLNLEVNEGEVIAEYVEVGIHGVGDTEQEAIRDFCQCLIEYYECLREARHNLAERAREHWVILQGLVAESDAQTSLRVLEESLTYAD